MEKKTNNKYRLVVFDMDGTILDTLEDLADSINYALAANGYPARSMDEVRRFVGNGIRKLVERAVPADTSNEAMNRVHETFTEYYKIHCADKTKPYEGINELITKLRGLGYLTAVVSNKADYGVQALCEKYFKGLFDMAVGEREGVRKKPYPDSVFAVLKALDIQKEEAIYIGDSDVDLETAKNSGMNCIAVEWGFRDREFLTKHGATVFAKEPMDILRFLND